MQDIGKITNTEIRANNLVNSLTKKLANLKEGYKEKETVKVYYVVGYGEYGEFTAGKGTYIDNLFKEVGLTNIAQDVEGWTYSIEKLYENNPDVILCSKYFDTKAGILAYEPYANLDAVKNGKVIEIDNNRLDRQGPRIVDALNEVLEKIYQ